jgi:hypothetical protein
LFKAFGYKYYQYRFNVSIGEEIEEESRFLHVDIKKVEQYLVPIVTLETMSSDGGKIKRLMSNYGNC